MRRARPKRLMASQNASMRKAERLKSKLSERRMSAAPIAGF